jgi:hypothetical protein
VHKIHTRKAEGFLFSMRGGNPVATFFPRKCCSFRAFRLRKWKSKCLEYSVSPRLTMDEHLSRLRGSAPQIHNSHSWLIFHVTTYSAFGSWLAHCTLNVVLRPKQQSDFSALVVTCKVKPKGERIWRIRGLRWGNIIVSKLIRQQTVE